MLIHRHPRPKIWLILLFTWLGVAACAEPVPSTTLSRNSDSFNPDSIFAEFLTPLDAKALLGDPISPLFDLPGANLRVQYFQRMRLEQDTLSNEIRITPLGAYFYKGDPETTPDIEGDFRLFYEGHGGAGIFGQPLTGQRIEGDRIVQYFSNALLEWHPDAPPAFRVQVAQLGALHFETSAEGVAYRQQRRFAPDGGATLQAAAVRATVTNPILYAGDTQEIVVEVLTPDGAPAADMAITAEVLGADGAAVGAVEARTNTQGIVRIILQGEEESLFAPGTQVQVKIVVWGARSTEEIGSRTVTFRTWW